MTEKSTIVEAAEKYQNEWDKMGPVQYRGCLILLPALLLILFSVIISAKSPSASNYLGISGFVLFALGAIYWKFIVGPPKCPRCKLNFDYYRPRGVRYCVNCGLPRYYGSTRYFDLWGSKDGNEMAQRIARGDL